MELYTDRLVLRPIEEKDAVTLHPLINDAEVAAGMLCVPHPYPREILAPWIALARKATERRERFEMSIVLKTSGLPIGACSLCEVVWDCGSAELGYWLGKKYWGMNIMTEAVTRMVQYAFEDLRLERIHARCFTCNLGSARVLEKAGFIREGCGRHEVKKNGEYHDVYHYSILRSDTGSC